MVKLACDDFDPSVMTRTESLVGDDRAALIFRSVVTDPFVAHVLAWIGKLWNVRIDRIAPSEGEHGRRQVVIHYGEAPNPFIFGLEIPLQKFDAHTPPPLLENFDTLDVERLLGRFPFDLFEAIRYWMTDRGHAGAPAEHFDEHGRLPFDRSVFAGHGSETAEPIVNRYILLLGRMIEHAADCRFSPIWPAGRKACVILSHDVDAPLDEGAVWSAFHSAGARWRVGQYRGAGYMLLSAGYQRLRRIARGRLRSDRHWNFEQIVRNEAEYGVRSTFFFATRHRWDQGAHRCRDVAYDVGVDAFRRVFAFLRNQGAEIGLHASYNAIVGDGTFEEEVHRLRRESGAAVSGTRHHFWRLGRDLTAGLRIHERAGMDYDSSIAFNEGIGWRMGIGLPYFPWDESAGRGLRVLQIPPMLMDGALWYRPIGMDQALARVDSLLDALVRHQAIGSIDWHDWSSFPGSGSQREWGLCYQAIVKRLAQRSDIWVATCDEVCRHWAARGV